MFVKLNRCKAMARLLLVNLMLCCSVSAYADGNDIVIGQSTALTGILAELGVAHSTGAKAYFDYVNSQGGVNGRKIRLITLDDAYDAKKSLANAKQLIEKEKAVALFGMLGTPANTVLLPVLEEANILSFAPVTGADVVRKPFNRRIFNIRAGYTTETEKIIDHLNVRGIKKIGVVVQNNAFGKEGLAGIEQAIAKHQLKLTATVSINSDSSDLDKAVSAMEAADVQTIILITAGKPSSDFIQAFNKKVKGMQYFALSVLASQAGITALGKDGVGVIISQVLPFPYSATTALVREYQKVMGKMNVKEYSYLGIEGFLDAKVFVEAIKRAGKDVNSERLITALEGMGRTDFDGFIVNFGKNNHQGSDYAELTVVSKDGRFLR
ncbi:ABC transporter substrate-binding protein [Undibacterium sp. YM2]|uniref:ABC transporter substrate-binding protein n=1 Tax=Undibacterium sp. YM2 TaxID=2058625 RepID=UPI001389644C|nr:ABC transporter substrate-binding protein [Undibacterium sp. YM2]